MVHYNILEQLYCCLLISLSIVYSTHKHIQLEPHTYFVWFSISVICNRFHLKRIIKLACICIAAVVILCIIRSFDLMALLQRFIPFCVQHYLVNQKVGRILYFYIIACRLEVSFVHTGTIRIRLVWLLCFIFLKHWSS